MSRPMATEWAVFLHNRNIFIDESYGLSRHNAMNKVLNRSVFLPSTPDFDGEKENRPTKTRVMRKVNIKPRKIR